MTEQKRMYKPEEKLKIVMEGLSGKIQISELCRKYNIKSARFYYLERPVDAQFKGDIRGQGKEA
ncbi:MAG: hypothetical protein AMDU2_EPLC00009G0003 [Thermoplasmatales archaeon E-plasma]|nr:MAG: hypothetical protein AMDU2_EPLC00010G0003 [Thermoplasmatales archaeon E-plasma]EQB65760.1 MAG: hypothetical protein AMDU2_EPLC00009G0003 [Thermoplasmatales archaeon E-plasma]